MAAKTTNSGEPDGKALVALIRRAEAGDKNALQQVKELCGTRLAPLWETYGNLAQAVESQLIGVASDKNALQREALTERMAQLRRELAGPNPSPVETLLVERIALCWLQMYLADAWDAQGVNLNRSLAQSDHHHARAERAQRRFLQAVKSLATVRRLAVPLLQVNVAGQQIVANGDLSAGPRETG